MVHFCPALESEGQVGLIAKKRQFFDRNALPLANFRMVLNIYLDSGANGAGCLGSGLCGEGSSFNISSNLTRSYGGGG